MYGDILNEKATIKDLNLNAGDYASKSNDGDAQKVYWYEQSFFLALLGDLIKYRLDHRLDDVDMETIDLWKELIHPVRLAWNDNNKLHYAEEVDCCR
jgi:hypothetical protein